MNWLPTRGPLSGGERGTGTEHMSIHDPEDTAGEDANDGGLADGPETGGANAAARLACTLVRYDGEPDRVTVYPPDASSVARMATWISADADACLDVDGMR